MRGYITEISVNSIITGRFNPRKAFDEEHIKELANSIMKDGQWDPIIVRRLSDHYELIAGECRLRAVKRLGLSSIQARVLDVDDDEANLLALKTNVMRRDLTPVEEAYGIKKLIDAGWSLQKVAKELDKSQTWVFYRLKLAENASEGLRNAVLTQEIPLSSAVKIAELPEGLQGPVISKVIRERLNTKEVEGLVDLLKSSDNESDLELFLGMPLKELMRPDSDGVKTRIKTSRKNRNITVVECECGIKHIVDWINRKVVMEREFHERR
jgi:ParB family chromosome partitioning protein